MAEGGLDPCECDCTMRRLMDLLRRSQSYCTDTGCPQELPSPGPPPGGDLTLTVVLMGWLVLVLAFFVLRLHGPGSGSGTDPAKPSRSHGNDGREPPPAPPLD